MQKLKIFLSLLLVGSMFAMYVPQVHASGTWTQSDWSGGSGQTAWSATNQYNSQGGDGLYDTSANQLSMKINAAVEVGQANLSSFPSGGSNRASITPYGMSNPYGLIVVGTKLIMTDSSNGRVLVWNTIPTASNTPADVVIGQPSLYGYNAPNQGESTAANTLYTPYDVASDGTRLFVADYGNNRVLIYNTIPITDNASADVVIGQVDMVHADNTSIAANTLSGPQGVYTDGTKLYISDTGNSRVLIYNTIPTTDGASADVVIGQADMTHGATNQGGSVAANTLSYPKGIFSYGTKFFVADSYNNRVLIYNTIPATNGASADVVIGQVDMTHNSLNQGLTNPTADRLASVSNVYSPDGTHLWVSDSYNRRVLIYNTIPTTDGASADVVVGQPDMTTYSDVGATTTSIRTPAGISSDGTKLFVVDNGNQRVLIYDTIPTTDGAAADIVLGQANFTTGTANSTSISAGNYLYSSEGSALVVGSKLIVADSGDNRVLIHSSIPVANDASADVVIGQAGMTTTSANQGGAASASTLYSPTAVSSDGTRLFIADKTNNRVLIYNTIPTTDGASADVVVGQPDKTTVTSGTSATKMKTPSDVFTDGTKLYVVDNGNNRVLIYNTIPTTDGASADVVVGQPDKTTVTSGTSATKMKTPTSVYSDGTKLYVLDSGNNRVLIYNTIPTTDGASADVVVGQPDFVSGTLNQGRGTTSALANTLYTTKTGIGGRQGGRIFVSGSKLYIADFYNNRVLIFNSIPTTNNASADAVVGQSNFTSSYNNQNTGVAANTLFNPSGVSSDSSRVYITEYGNSRLLIYSGPHQSTLTSSTFTSTTPDTTWGPLSYDATVPTNTSISFEYSGNGGTTWQTITDPANQSLGTSKTMTYRVTLSNTDGISTPVLHSVSIAYTTATGGGGLAGGLPTTANTTVDNTGSNSSSNTSSPTTTNPLANNTPANSSTTPNACQPGDKYDIYTGLPCTTTTATTNAGQTSLSITTSTNSCTITQTLREGSKGNDVKCLQRDLTITQDGLFGPKTKQSVISFQKNHNLTPDGVVGPKTRAVLNQ